jgi:hypothetical protein
MSKSVFYYKPLKKDDTEIETALKEKVEQLRRRILEGL